MADVRKLRSLRFCPSAGTIAALVLGVAFSLMVARPTAQAQTYNVIYNFTGGQDGAVPWAGVTMDVSGNNLYGTASMGGTNNNNDGTVYKLTHKNGIWMFSTLYAFTGGNDGANPYARVVFGPDGSLYGTTTSGGATNNTCPTGCGTVFNLKPTPTRPPTPLTPWVETTLYRFQGSPDGGYPGPGDLVFDDSGAMYGATSRGGYLNCGVNEGCGVVYKMTPSGRSWIQSVIYSFTGIDDGGIPPAVAVDGAGNLYVTAEQYGTYGAGAVIELTPTGSGWTETTIYDFCAGGLPCLDGAYPGAGVIVDKLGNLYGTTYGGGPNGGGTAFELSPSGGSSTYKVLYGFVGYGQSGEALLHVEQAQPRQAVLIQDSLVNVLLVKLLDLCCRHLAAIRRQVAIGLGAHLQQGFIRSGGKQGSEKFLLRDRQPSLKVFHLHRSSQ